MADTGRPRLYPDPEEFASKTDAYFKEMEAKERPPTLAGLCLFLGFSDKQSFSNYESYGDEFSLTVTRARLMIEVDRHERLIDKGLFTPGVAFDLKNNHGWKDKTEQELTGVDGGPVQFQRIERVIVGE